MAGKSRFLPESISGALKSLLRRVWGAVVLTVGLWATFSLLFYNSYLDGFGVVSTFGVQSVMGYVVGMLRYAVGTMVGLFMVLCVARWGAVRLIGLDLGNAPEYNFMRGFIAVCLGAAGFGLIAPKSVFGGMFGAIAAYDIGLIFGSTVGVVIGLGCIVAFLWIGGCVLHIKWAHLRGALKMFVRWLRMIGAAFHLTGAVAVVQQDDLPDELEEEATEKESAVDEVPEKKARRGILGRRVTEKKVVAPVAAVAVAPKRVRASSVYKLPDPKL